MHEVQTEMYVGRAQLIHPQTRQTGNCHMVQTPAENLCLTYKYNSRVYKRMYCTGMVKCTNVYLLTTRHILDNTQLTYFFSTVSEGTEY